MIDKPPECKACPLYHIGQGFVPFQPKPGPYLMVGEQPGQDEAEQGKCFVGGSGQWLRNLCTSAGIDWNNLSLTNCVSCNTRQDGKNIFPSDPKWDSTKQQGITREQAQKAVSYCARTHLWPAIEKAGKDKIFAIGGQALQTLTGRSGIKIWRGSPLPLLGSPDKPRVIPTIHPAALMREAKFSSVVARDLKKNFTLPPENYNLFPTIEDLKRFTSKIFAFDLEWDAQGNPTICGLSDSFYTGLVAPWRGPYLTELKRIFTSAKALIGHNIIQADLPFIERMGWDVSSAIIHDTMLKQHLVQPDYPHDLGFVASVFTNKTFWKGKGWEEEAGETGLDGWHGQQWRTWDKPYAISRKLGGYGGCVSTVEAFNLYNARDTDAEFQINTPLDLSLKKYSLEDVYHYVSLPVAFIVRDPCTHGLKLNTSRLGEVRKEIDEAIVSLETQLPEGLKPYEETVRCNLPAPPGAFKAKIKTCKGTRKKPHECIEFTFTQPSESSICSECGKQLTPGKMGEAKIIKGTRLEKVVPYNSAVKIQDYVDSLSLKTVYDTKSGRKTTGKKAQKVWAKDRPEFTILGALKKKITLRNNFAKDTLLKQERMFFNLKVHGTSEGRLSSSGKREGVDLNIQNQPKEFRKIYIPDYPDWGFLSLDIVQGENMLTTWLAKDWPRWERLQQGDYNEHADLASRIFNRSVRKNIEADKPFYDVGKIFNHSKNYGAGPKKQQEILLEHGYDHYSLADLKEFNAIWENLNAGTARWQRETIETATKQSYLRNPFGRARWFSSRDIAAKALAFLPASTLADAVLRMMIAHFPTHPRCRVAIEKLGLKVYMPLVEDWIFSIQVHDEIVHQGPWKDVIEQAERSTQIMTQPWDELDGFRFGVDVKASPKSWGECGKLEKDV